MENYFNIRYEFDKRAVLQAIDEALLLGKPGYICVSDGVILSTVNRDPDYRQVVDGAMFSICDSGYIGNKSWVCCGTDFCTFRIFCLYACL